MASPIRLLNPTAVHNGYKFNSLRFLSVRELPWCAPSDSPVRSRSRARSPTTANPPNHESSSPETNLQHIPIERFGIVAAASSCKKQVIGIDGGLPWSIPKDRELFKSLTREKILIIGRRTLEECPSLVHVKHTSHCIIVSKSMRNLDDYKTKHVNCELKIVRSFPEALHCARNLATETSKDNNNSLQCWVGGGQSLFEKALRHPSAAEIHLSWVQLEMDISSNNEYARFPAKYRWDHKFKPFSEKLYPGNPKTPSFVYSIYKLQKQMDS